MRSNIAQLIILFTIIISGACSKTQRVKFTSEWSSSPDGIWAGPELWANRLQDWEVVDGKLLCINSKPMRTVHLTTRKATEEKGN